MQCWSGFARSATRTKGDPPERRSLCCSTEPLAPTPRLHMGTRWTSWPGKSAWRSRSTGIAVLLTAYCSMMACKPSADSPVPSPTTAVPPPAPAGAKKHNVLVWVVDTLRPDHLSVYGYERQTSPRLEELADQGVVFENARAPSPWTKPSTASLLTGVCPKKHGAVGYYGRLEGPPLLSTHLQARGYQTVAFSANPWVHPRWGFGSGFTMFNTKHQELYNKSASAVVRALLAYLREDASEPFFCYVHILDPHDAYAPPPPFDTMWGKRLPQRAVMGRHLHEPPSAVIEDLIRGYDGEIAFADEQFGVVLDELRERGLYDDTLVVFTSDHGEEFFEHGLGGHGRTLHEELIRIPLVVKFPGAARAGRRIDGRVNLMDIPPTVLSWAAGGAAPGNFDGTDLLQTVDGGAELMGEERSLFLQTDHTIGAARTPERSILNGVLHGPYKYIEQRSPIARRMLFNLTDDPAETTDLLRDEPNVAEELASMLGDYLSASRPGIHLRIVNRPVKAPSLSRYRVLFSTTGRFTVLETRIFEKDDSAHISPNGRSLLIRTTGNNKQATGAGGGLIRHNWWIIDEERVVFQVDPSDSKHRKRGSLSEKTRLR